MKVLWVALAGAVLLNGMGLRHFSIHLDSTAVGSGETLIVQRNKTVHYRCTRPQQAQKHFEMSSLEKELEGDYVVEELNGNSWNYYYSHRRALIQWIDLRDEGFPLMEYTLGQFSHGPPELVNVTSPDGSQKKALLHKIDNGTFCPASDRARFGEVVHACLMKKRNFEIVAVEEPLMCNYRVWVHVPLLCQYPDFANTDEVECVSEPGGSKIRRVADHDVSPLGRGFYAGYAPGFPFVVFYAGPEASLPTMAVLFGKVYALLVGTPGFGGVELPRWDQLFHAWYEIYDALSNLLALCSIERNGDLADRVLMVQMLDPVTYTNEAGERPPVWDFKSPFDYPHNNFEFIAGGPPSEKVLEMFAETYLLDDFDMSE